MLSYNNSNVVQCLRQYDMFANSLNLVKSREEKSMIIKQLTKLESKIIELTNELYEDEYYAIANKECSLLEEEKNRLTMLIELINQRLSYVEKQCNNHYQLTGDSLDIAEILGASTLDNLEDRVKIIDKYSKNIKLKSELEEEVKSLANKISLASEKIDINKSLNEELEKKFTDLLSTAFEKLGLYEMLDNKGDIEYAYYETEKSLTLAELNLEMAKTSPVNVLNDCQTILEEVRRDYVKYKDKMSVLKLMEIFNREVFTYEELLSKRKEIIDLFKYIKNEELVNMVLETIVKQYNTIMMEQQDINTYNDLNIEKERKENALIEIETENNSEQFQDVLGVLIENERKKQEKVLEEQRKIEEEEKKKRLEVERQKQEEILRRQKIIEDARKKDMEKRTKELLEQQQNSVLQSKKQDEPFSFSTIKDITENEIEVTDDTEKKKNTLDESIVFKNKIDIEKELFDEFNEKSLDKPEPLLDDAQKEKKDIFEEKKEDKPLEMFNDKVEDDSQDDFVLNDNSLPDVTLDEYMKNFKEQDAKETDLSLILNDDIFPSIPV